MTSDRFILRTISGYEIPFTVKVFRNVLPKEPHYSIEEQVLVGKVIEDLLEKGAISKCQPIKDQFISPFFLIDKPNGDKRFVLNLKKLNEFIIAPHFKMENIRSVLKLLTRKCYMASLDLKDSYFLVPIAQKHKKYLRFAFRGNVFQFNCLPFGLCTAPQAFTKLMKPVIHSLRSKGFISIIYLDDILLIGGSKQECLENVCATRDLLESLGLKLNLSKCQLNPAYQCKYLGYILDNKEFCISLPEKKKHEILDLALNLRVQEKCKIRKVAEFLGKLA